MVALVHRKDERSNLKIEGYSRLRRVLGSRCSVINNRGVNAAALPSQPDLKVKLLTLYCHHTYDVLLLHRSTDYNMSDASPERVYLYAFTDPPYALVCLISLI